MPFMKLWGADPGVTDIFVASSGSDNVYQDNPDDQDEDLDEEDVPEQEPGEPHQYDLQERYRQRQQQDPHEIRRFSSAEYYTKAGYKKTTRLIREAKDQQQIDEVEATILTNKTSTMQGIEGYITSILTVFDQLTAFYGRILFQRRKFSNYCGRQRMDAELVNIFTNGGTKYGDHHETYLVRNQELEENFRRTIKYSRRLRDRKKQNPDWVTDNEQGPMALIYTPMAPVAREPAGQRTL
ncbi:uncharacterized protein BX664DRAFT_116090 [Halteromyces radiatus]|uniref:uncharacterized protein n=1 Tax=Halteromyces radiatus TaxID=101107 RepID=UPI00221E9EFC|nr:uncharacterized protein BX664DRAFT_116090 [Halteromyces radiatus]KAI8093879.1 hypothetical protein BX664DRAFT_116090 [Halteromyces radiatus]